MTSEESASKWRQRVSSKISRDNYIKMSGHSLNNIVKIEGGRKCKDSGHLSVFVFRPKLGDNVVFSVARENREIFESKDAPDVSQPFTFSNVIDLKLP